MGAALEPTKKGEDQEQMDARTKRLKKVDKLLLPCEIQGKSARIWALIDTGSQLTVVHERMVKGKEILKSKKSMVAANDTTISVKGKVEISLRIGRLVLPVKAYVTRDLIEDVLIGMKFLWANKADIICSKSKFIIGPEKIREHFIITDSRNLKEIKKSIKAIRIKEEVILQPKEGTVIETKEEVEIKDRKFLEENGLEEEVVDYGKRRKIYIFNMSNAAKRLRKGQIVAEAKEAKVLKEVIKGLSLIHISEPTRPY